MSIDNQRREGFLTFFRTLVRTVPTLWRAAPLETSLLSFILVVQGLIPALTIYLTLVTVDGITRLIQGGDVELVWL
ncbi:MAG: hypothetical protein M3434_05390, partial [Gemmatimonadota bacterium]|nr:hypothetical protein [Gemmatimonadota bacterium]